MARQKFVHFVPRPKPRKRPGIHKKRKNKDEKRDFKKYNRQGRRAKLGNITRLRIQASGISGIKLSKKQLNMHLKKKRVIELILKERVDK